MVRYDAAMHSQRTQRTGIRLNAPMTFERARRYFDVAVLPTSFIAGTYPPIAGADEAPEPPDTATLSFGAVTLAATPPALPLAACMLGRPTEPVPILLAGDEAACA